VLVRAQLAGFDRALEEAALDFAARPSTVLMRVTLPGILTSGVLRERAGVTPLRDSPQYLCVARESWLGWPTRGMVTIIFAHATTRFCIRIYAQQTDCEKRSWQSRRRPRRASPPTSSNA